MSTFESAAGADRRFADLEIQRTRLDRYLRWSLPIGVAFAAALATCALVLWDVALAAASVVVCGQLVALAAAKRATRRGQVERGAQIAGHGLQVMTLVAALFVPFAFPALVMLPILAAASVLPYLTGRKLRAVCIAAFLVNVWVLACAALLGAPFGAPPAAVQLAVFGAAILTASGLTLLLLFLDTHRLHRSLDAAALGARALAAESKLKDEFLAMLGHELRNPLAATLTAVLAAKRHPAAPARELDVVERQTRHLARLLDDLLDVSRLSSQCIELRRERAVVAECVKRAIEVARPVIDDRKHAISVDLERGLEVWGDPARLEQIVGNLLSNAAKYTPPGGRIRVTGRNRSGQVCLTVEDNGRGIPPEMRDRIFKLFVQGERALDRGEGGLGIGLTVVQRLVQLHGGAITVESPGRGRGSAFTVTLPAAGPEASPAPEPQPGPATEAAASAGPARALAPAHDAASGVRVLVVDDNIDAAEMLGETLRTKGYEVELAFDGPSALRRARDVAPDVVLLDLGLPGLDGYEVARELRRTEHPPKLIAVTGYSQPSDRAKTHEAGFSAHLVKPIEPSALAELLELKAA